MGSYGIKVCMVLCLCYPALTSESESSGSSSQESTTLEKSSDKASSEINPTVAPNKDISEKGSEKRIKNRATSPKADPKAFQRIESEDSKYAKAVKFKKFIARGEESNVDTSGVVRKPNKMKRKKKKGGEKYEKMKKLAAAEKARGGKSALTTKPRVPEEENPVPKRREKRESNPHSDEPIKQNRDKNKRTGKSDNYQSTNRKDKNLKRTKAESVMLTDKRKAADKSSLSEILPDKSFADQSKYELPSTEYAESSEDSQEEPRGMTEKSPDWSQYIEDYSGDKAESSEESHGKKAGKAFKKLAKDETESYESEIGSAEEKNRKQKKPNKYKSISQESSGHSKRVIKKKSKLPTDKLQERPNKIKEKGVKSSEEEAKDRKQYQIKQKQSKVSSGKLKTLPPKRYKYSSEEHSKVKHSSEEHGKGKHSSEEHGKRKHSSEEHSKGKHSSEEHGKGKHSSEEHGKRKHSSEEHSKGKHSSEEHGKRKHSSEKHGKGKHSSEEHGKGKHSSEEHSKGKHSSEEHGKAKHSSEEHNKAKQSSEEHHMEEVEKMVELTTRPRKVRKFKIELPPGRNKTNTLLGTRSFYDLATKSDTFVDKTDFITDILCDEKILHFTRPRKWGRSMTIDMLKRFFELELDDFGNHLYENEKLNKKLFRGGIKTDLMPELDKLSTPRLRRKKKKLAAIDEMRYRISPALKISQDSKAMMHLGKYPVMVFKFKNLKGDTYAQVLLAMKNLVFLQFKRYSWLLKRKIGYANKKMYIQYLKINMPDEQFVKTGIGFITKMVHKIFKKRVVFFIDDEDYPVLQYMKNNYFDTEGLDKIHALTKEFITKLGEDPNIHQGIIFGTMHIKQTTGLLPEYYMPYSVNDPSYNTLLGFTDEEVDRLLTNKTDVAVSKRELKKWYSGYNMGGKELYNPWCVLNCIHQGGKIQPYFTEMPYTRILRKGIPRDVIIKLIHDEGVGVAYLHQLLDFTYLRTYQAFIKSLMHAGYVTNFRNKLYIPNKEIYNFFSNTTYFKRINQTKSAENLEIMHKKDGI